MKNNWPASFTKTEVWEGWHLYSNDKFDPGGATYSGVIQRTYNAYRASKGLPIQGVQFMTDAECSDIMKTQFWDAIQGDVMFSGLDYELYDIAVNSGPVTAIKFLQQALRIPADGQIGIVTLGAVRTVNDQVELIKTIAAARMSFWHSLSTWWRYGRGWSSRGAGTLQFSLSLHSEGTGA